MMSQSVYAVVVTFNGVSWLEKCLSSLETSGFPVTTIVVDNASTDGTPELVREKFPGVNLIQSGKNSGFGNANNVGIKQAYNAGASSIFLLNQDAWVNEHTIERLITVSQRHQEYGILSPIHYQTDWKTFDKKFGNYVRDSKCPGFLQHYSTSDQEEIYACEFVNAAAWLITRHCLSVVGLFEPLFFLYGEDDNYIQRMIWHGFRVGIVPQAGIVHDRTERKGEKNEIGKPLEIRTYLYTKVLNPNYSLLRNFYNASKVFRRFGFNARSLSNFSSLLMNFLRIKKAHNGSRAQGYRLR
jgi:GT2 family glycosyltransferase